MKCKECGHEYSDDSKFCPSCGAANNGGETVAQSAAPVNVNVTVEAPAAAPQDAIKKKGFGAKFIGVLLWLILVFSLVATALVLTCNYVITPMGLKGLAKSGVMDELVDADDYMNDAFSEIGIKEKYLDSKDLENFRYQLYSDAIKFYLTGEGVAMDPDLFINLIKDNADDIEEKTGVELTKSDYKDLEEQLDDLNDEFAEEREEEFEDEPALMIVAFLFKTSSLLILIAVDIFLCLLIMLVFGKNKDKSKIYTGVSSIFAAILTLGFVGLMFVGMEQTGSMEAGEIIALFFTTIVIGVIYFICGIIGVVSGRSFRKKHTYI